MAYLQEDVSLYCLYSDRGAANSQCETEDGQECMVGRGGGGLLVRITESFVEFKKRSGHRPIALRCLSYRPRPT